MTQSAPFHRRSPSSPHVSKSKSTRPALHRRGTSGATVTFSKLGSGQKGASKSTSADDTEFDMASFLNFWYVTPKLLSLNPAGIISSHACCRHLCSLHRSFVHIKADPIPAPCVKTKLLPPTTVCYIVAKGMW